jgi:ribonuclease J
VGEVVLRDRRALASDGMFIVVVTVDKQTGKVVARPEIVTRGFVHGNESDPLMQGAVDHILAAVEGEGDRTSEVGLLKSQIKDEVSKYLYEQTRRRPLVFPVVVEV